MSYYTVTGAPVQDTRGTSPSIRAEFALIAAGFAALPVQATIWGASQNYGVDTGSADAYVVSIAATYITGYTDGLTIKFKAGNANTGPATVNLNTLGLKTIVRPDGSALAAGDIPAGAIVTAIYNTTTGKFQLALSSVASATSAAASAAAALASQLAAAASATAAANSATAAANSAAAAAASAASINPADLMHLSGVETATGNKTFSGNVAINGALSGAGVNKAAVGLGNVDNTSDVNKPVSTAQQTALNLKTALSQMLGFYPSSVRGLIGANNATTPLTKYDLQALAVTLRNSAGETVTQLNTATITCDLGLAGSSANGRDQSAAFTASQWIYLYFIWNGATLATLASTTAPASFTGSTLPTGYTHWAFATALRWNASSNLLRTRTQGASVFYDVDFGSAVLSAGSSTTYAALSLAAFVPPIALSVTLEAELNLVHSVTSPFISSFRPTGSSMSGNGYLGPALESIAAQTMFAVAYLKLPLGTSSSVDYKLSSIPNTAGGLNVDVQAYRIANGDS